MELVSVSESESGIESNRVSLRVCIRSWTDLKIESGNNQVCRLNHVRIMKLICIVSKYYWENCRWELKKGPECSGNLDWKIEQRKICPKMKKHPVGLVAMDPNTSSILWTQLLIIFRQRTQKNKGISNFVSAISKQLLTEYTNSRKSDNDVQETPISYAFNLE